MLRSSPDGRATVIKTIRSLKLLQSKKPNRSGGIQTEDYTFLGSWPTGRPEKHQGPRQPPRPDRLTYQDPTTWAFT